MTVLPALLMDRTSFLAPFGDEFLASLDGVGRIVWNGAMLHGEGDEPSFPTPGEGERDPRRGALGGIQRYTGPQRWALGFGGIIHPKNTATVVQYTRGIFKPQLCVWGREESGTQHLDLKVHHAIVEGKRRNLIVPVSYIQAEVHFEAVPTHELVGLHVANDAEYPVEFRFLLIGLAA